MGTDPSQQTSDSTHWHANFWNFLSIYLEERFGKAYCLSAESSLALHTGSNTLPSRVTIITQKSSGQTITLPFNTSLFLYKDEKNLPQVRELKNGLQIMSLSEAISRLTKSFYTKNVQEAEGSLSLVQDPEHLLHFLLKQGQTTTAGYLVGAYRHMGREEMAQGIFETMTAAGHRIIVENPFNRSEGA